MTEHDIHIDKTKLPFLSNFGIMLTYKCTISCPHCIVKAGPRRKKEMKVEDAYNYLEQIKSFHSNNESKTGVSLTGGEPFYNRKLLSQVAEYASNQGFIVSVVTNAFWAKTKEKAIEVLSELNSVQMISISTDIFHQEYIPFMYIKNAIYAAKKLDMIYNVAVATISEKEKSYIDLIDSLLEITEKENIQTAYIVPVGRAESNEKMGKFILTDLPPEAACSMAGFPVIFPDGNVIACIGPPITMPKYNPLYLGNLKKEKLTKILNRSDTNFLLHAIRTFGPKMLVDQLKRNGFKEMIPDKFLGDCPCDICYKLFSNEDTCSILSKIFESYEIKEKVAYGRFYYLNEISMLEKLGLISEEIQ